MRRLLPLLLAAAAVLTAQPKTNFIILFADDLGYGDLSSYGATAHQTPHLDRMASEGVRFTDFYVPMPFCAPSRASILTGRYPFRHTLVANPSPDAGKNDIGLPPEEVTIAEALKPLGYATSAIGKWHLGHVDQYLPRRQGFDEYYGILYSNDMRPVQLVENERVVEYPVVQSKLTQEYTRRAIDFIERNREKPFFLYLPHAMPHKPLAASEDFYTPETPGDLYSDAVRELDWSVGEILAALRRLGLAERTLVLFSSDNGPTYGGETAGLRGRKSSSFDGGLRVPGIAWQPGTVSPGRVSGALAGTIDFLPTILTAAGAPPPQGKTIDGKDLGPLLRGETDQGPHEAIFAMAGDQLRMVRSGRWKLHVRTPRPGFRCMSDAEAAEWVDPRAPDGVTIIAPFEQARPNQCPGLDEGPEPKPLMLFDMESDKGEQADVAAEHPEVVARLKDLFETLDAEAPAAVQNPSPRPDILRLKGGELRYDRVIRPQREK
ncbi:MAG: sulfatase-like hydrolase/transferase [Acidobacteria bacterium]|nr:sulfatase-like hydrolase/transferase [Acidobacteriota bacterium]